MRRITTYTASFQSKLLSILGRQLPKEGDICFRGFDIPIDSNQSGYGTISDSFGDTIVIGDTYRCTIDFPIKHPYSFDISINDDNLDLIVDAVRTTYNWIYNTEDATATEIVECDRFKNRGFTNGRFGIGGFYIDKLSIEVFFINPETKEIHFFIGC